MIALVRVDNRLIHGQVVETWIPRLRAQRVLVADDEAAGSALAQAAMALALPEELPLEVRAVEAVDWAVEAARPEVELVILKELSGLGRARGRGLTPALAARINLGNIHYAPGRRQLTPSVFLREEELAEVAALAAAGFDVEARAIPVDVPAGAAELERRWRAAG